MPKRKPTLWRVHDDPKYAQERLIELAKLVGWDPTCTGAPDMYLEEKLREWIRIREASGTLRRLLGL